MTDQEYRAASTGTILATWRHLSRVLSHFWRYPRVSLNQRQFKLTWDSIALFFSVLKNRVGWEIADLNSRVCRAVLNQMERK